MDVDVLSLRVFVTVARERHFGRAATHLRLSVSAVSKHLARLEAALGVVLVDRSSAGVAGLTPAGGAILVEAAAVVAAVDRLPEAPARRQSQDVVIALPAWIGEHIPAAAWPVLASLVAREAPGVRIRLRGKPFQRVEDVLSAGDADIVIDTVRRLPAGVERRQLATIARSLAVAGSDPITEDVVGAPLAESTTPLPNPELCPVCGQSWSLDDVDTQVTTGLLPGARSSADFLVAVVTGGGQDVVPSSRGADGVEQVSLVPSSVGHTPLYAVHRRNPSAAERLVLELLELLAGALVPQQTAT